ncbi:MAG TPA: glycosyltransferase family 39 protein [Blastocatellia bacterium]|nr:glycosyltransferase family 39 protein [Blastocatellia bacterium]
MDSRDWKGDYRIWLPLALLAWALALVVRDPFIADWDGFDYAAEVVQGLPSVLGLGRALFLAYNRALWLLAHHWFGLPPERAFLVIKYGVIAQSGPAIVGLYALYKELMADRLAALLGSLMVALSPLYVIYSGRGMSEIPGTLMWGWSLWWMLRSLRLGNSGRYLVAAALFGLGANMREFAVFYLPVVALAGWIYGVRWVWPLSAFVIAVFAALAGPVFWALFQPDYYLPAVRAWYRVSAQERREHQVTIRNLWLLIAYAFICSPAATLITPAAYRSLYRRFFPERSGPDRQQRLLLLVSFFGLLSAVMLVANHDLAVNPRYLLTGLLGLAPLGGWWLAELVRKKSRLCYGVMTLLALLTLSGLIGMEIYLDRVQWPRTYATRDYVAKISALPDQSVFIVGRNTPLVNFYRAVGARPRWQVIPFGSGWPDERLGEVIDLHLKEGRPVYVDLDRTLWSEGMRDHSRESAGLEMIRRSYQLESVRDSLCRVSRRL